MKIFGLTLLALCFMSKAEAGFQYNGGGYQSGYGGGGGYSEYDSPGYGGSYGPQRLGENVSNNSGFLSCGCATRIKLGKESEDVACDNYSRLHQQMILNPGSAIPTTAPTHL